MSSPEASDNYPQATTEQPDTQSPVVPCILDWTDVPSVQDLEALLGFKYWTTTRPTYTYPYYYAPAPARIIPLRLAPTDYVAHDTSSEDELLELYAANGFDTFVVLQNPLTHQGASPACPIGFTSNLPNADRLPELKLFRRWVCRVHVDVGRLQDQRLISVPHVEIDPGFHPVQHLQHQGQEVKGKTAVRVLNEFLK